MGRAVILNSRQSLRPHGGEEWIRRTVEAVALVKQQGNSLSVSEGTKPWEIVLTLASDSNIPINLYCHESDKSLSSDKIIVQFGIDNENLSLHPVKSDYKSFPNNRDRAIVNDAGIIIPVSIRPGGNLEELIDNARESGKNVIEDFRVTYKIPKSNAKTKIDKSRINPEIDTLLKDHIIHWTKTPNGPWPDETLYDYYHAILKSQQQYPRTAFETLKNILRNKIIFTSVKHYRAAYPAVAFSETSPSEAADLMKWRARFREMTFEPYGIAIPIDVAENLKISRAIYGEPEVYELLSPKNRPFFQPVSAKSWWLPEKEWRHIGNFNLDEVDNDRIVAIAMTPEESTKLASEVGIRVVSYYE